MEGVINSQDLFLVQGPPGTGKTTVIAEICYQNAIRNQKTLIASQTNLAVDNALSKLVHHPKIRALRKGNEQSVQEEGVLFTENNVIETWLNKTATECRKLITSKEVEVQAAEAAEKELASIVNQYNKYIASTENCKSNIVKKENIEEVIKKLKSQIAWLEENYSDFINEIKGNAYDSIIINPYALGDEFINTVKCIHSTTIEQEQTRLKHESNINVINKESSMLQSSIDAISSIFNKANKNKKYIVTDEKMLSGKALSFLEWQAEAKLLEDEINLVKQKKPFSILIYIGLARKWMFSVCSLLNHYNEFKVCTELTVLDENMNLKKLLLDDKVDIMLNDLKKLFETTDIEWKENVNELIKDIRDIEIEIFKDTQNISDSQEVIDNFNKCLPYDVKAENVEQVSHMVDIQQYYLSLWKQQKASDLKYIRFITDWVQRIERKSEEDYKTFKQLYIDNANVIGITCSQSGSKEFTEQYPTFDVAIIDEVSKATPPELILAVLKAKKIVLVGDHKQLPPMIGMETYEEVAKQLDISEDKTTHMKTSLFEELFINASNTLKIMLSTQYRMHNQIMDSINQFYTDENELGLICGINNPDIMREHHCYGKAIERKNHIMWVDIPLIKEHFEEQSYTNYSFSNQAEVDCIKNILLTISANLYANNYNGQKKIGIISFYSNQVRLLEKELLDKEFADRICNLSLRIGSVDRFQGIECPVIICSFVRNNPKGEIGFAKDPRRVNVALSRAQELSIIVGCSELFCSTNKNSSATRIYQTIAKIILDVGGIRNALDFR